MNQLSADDILKVQRFLKNGFSLAQINEKEEAVASFKQALAIDAQNETALMWCAYLTKDPCEAKGYLQKVVEINPENQSAQSYLEMAKAQCTELNSLIDSSDLISQWLNPGSNDPNIPRIGQYFINKGLLTSLQVRVALEQQEQLKQKGQKVKLGDILISMGLISQQQLRKVLTQINTEYNNRFMD